MSTQERIDAAYLKRRAQLGWLDTAPTWAEDFNDAALPGWGYQEPSWGADHHYRTEADGRRVYYLPENVSVADSVLTLKTTGYTYIEGGTRYQSAGLVATMPPHRFRYGRFEIRAKLGTGGCKGCGWMYGTPVPPELDTMEQAGTFSATHSLHWNGYESRYTRSSWYHLPLSWHWHYYALDWRENGLCWFFDGRPVVRDWRGNPIYFNYSQSVTLGAMSMLLSVEVPGANSKPGQMQVDWVRQWA